MVGDCPQRHSDWMSGQWKLDWIGLWRGWIAGGGKGREWPSLEGFDRCLVATDNAEDGPWGDGQGISLWGNRWAMNGRTLANGRSSVKVWLHQRPPI